MPTARQTAGKLPGRNALLAMLKSVDDDAVRRVLEQVITSGVLKQDLKVETAANEGPAPGTFSLPGCRDTLFTRDGGVASRLLADEDMAAGITVTAGTAAYSSCRAHVAGDKDPPIGVLLESVRAGEMATVVWGGMARVWVPVVG